MISMRSVMGALALLLSVSVHTAVTPSAHAQVGVEPSAGFPATIEEAAERVQDVVRTGDYSGLMALTLTGNDLEVFHYVNGSAVEPPVIVPPSNPLPPEMVERLELMGHELRSHTPEVVTGAFYDAGDITVRDSGLSVEYHGVSGNWVVGFGFTSGPDGLVLTRLSWGEDGVTPPPSQVDQSLVSATERLRSVIGGGRAEEIWTLVDPAVGLSWAGIQEDDTPLTPGAPLPSDMQSLLNDVQAAQAVYPDSWFLTQAGTVTYRFPSNGAECEYDAAFHFVETTAGTVLEAVRHGRDCE